MKCPNCMMTFTRKRPHPENGCVLAAIAQCAKDRGTSPAEVDRLHAKADSDAFWNQAGKLVDAFENGEFSQ